MDPVKTKEAAGCCNRRRTVKGVLCTMNQKQYTTFQPFTKVLSVILVAVLAIAGYALQAEINRVHAETVYATEYILCRDYVLVRQWASKKAPEVGQLDPGDSIEVDGKTSDGFAHIVAPCDGWVWAGNIVFGRVEKVDSPAYVTAKKRVACRRWVDGPQVEGRPWMITGSECTVYYMDSEWAVTSRGYVRAEYLEVERQ